MSDLISRSELIKHFETIQSQEGAIGLDFVAIIDEIKEQPTAYYIDKVIKNFDKKYNNSSWIKGDEEFSITRNELIEIVKQDGVDDVCEWESVSDGEFIQNPHTKRLYSNEPSMQNVYCNTCGKKIKVVE